MTHKTRVPTVSEIHELLDEMIRRTRTADYRFHRVMCALEARQARQARQAKQEKRNDTHRA